MGIYINLARQFYMLAQGFSKKKQLINDGENLGRNQLISMTQSMDSHTEER